MVLGPVTLNAQRSTEQKLLRAKDFFVNGKYEEALGVLMNERELRRNDPEGRFLIALSNYHLNRLEDAEKYLEDILESDNPYPEVLMYLGRIYHARHDFSTAIDYYKSYLKSIDRRNRNREMIQDAVRRCANGLQMQFRQPLAYSENLGAQLNTIHDEFGPVPSPSRNDRLYFTSSRPGNLGGPRDPAGRPDAQYGRFFTDIYYATLAAGTWKEVRPMHYLLNSPRHEVLLGFSQGGRSMYYFQGDALDHGQVLIDTFRTGGQVLSTDPFAGPIDANAGFTSPMFYNSDLVIFASNRSGGYGGLDLYQTERINGRWTAPRNMGPQINSAYDETTPFLARDGKTLYYSSNDKRKSMGGYDVFKTQYLTEQKRWATPYNLGLPVNSAGDDTHFVLARDGYTAYLTTNRKDGYGQRDVYVAYFFEFLNEMTPTYSPSPVTSQRGGQ
jgi:tetratricopeptide (TPR) repeat protein